MRLTLILAALLTLTGCTGNGPPPETPYGTSIVKIDGCEYIRCMATPTLCTLTHKGNYSNPIHWVKK